jgi:diacylglycerol kinase (ATP)
VAVEGAPLVVIVINPISGTGGGADLARRRAHFAAARAEARGIQADVRVTERPGHARELTQEALERGALLAVAWGGDGTVNEVASALAFGDAALAVVPGGSGNGLARELGIPRDPAAAFDVAFGGHERILDAGELDGRLFFNVAGIGLDAQVADRFAANGRVRRGFARYLQIAARELLSFQPTELTIVADGMMLRLRALLVAIANGRQYGNGALIAPQARVDDGRLDLTAVAYRPLWRTVIQMPALFTGRLARVPGVTMSTAREIEMRASRDMLYHVDGEPHNGGSCLRARVHPGALRVRVAG